MPYSLIKGDFHIHYPDIPRQGPEPDGDTLKFHPDIPRLVEELPGGARARFNGRGMINIRFEAIDALETHFAETHQNPHWSLAARDSMLAAAGFAQVEFFDDLPHKVESVQPHPTRGYIYSNGLDSHGRVIAFVYTGETAKADGSSVFVTAPMTNSSLNAALLSDGLAYASFYTSLPRDLAEHLKNLTVASWNAGRGLWPEDTANPWWWQRLRTLADAEEAVMWPKLFRRLALYFGAGHQGLAGFDGWLREDPRDRDDRLLLPDRELGNMHDVIDTQGNWIRMKHWPEDLVILPDD